ncbi:hypothetical protein D9758_012115 [Tetrapyrgos nigripes]|uniref:DUF6535 domain-containing protein n=1 Tax=Tetrapyrgos nigripes TaxID=182062 RepID=A0A8H5CLD4_9AGAR|nr:hypothetical protein D9758_012115 [Tetrapyrgos nigripes]
MTSVHDKPDFPDAQIIDFTGREDNQEMGTSRSDEDDDACSKLWRVYIKEAQRYDETLLQGWKNDMEGMLLFSALYSAILAAFIIESYKNLQPDPTANTVILLTQIAQQLSLASNGASPQFEGLPPFQPPAASLFCNTMWFLSLTFALTCSLLATFVQQWTRDFIHKTSMRPSPVRHARVLAFAYLGMKEFGMHTFVDMVPMLLHISLFLFFAGLIGFLFEVNRPLTYVMACVSFPVLASYVTLSLLPLLNPASPYRTPLSNVLWRYASILDEWFLHKNHKPERGPTFRRATNLTEAVLRKSLDNPAERDFQAIKYTLLSLADDAELLPFIEALPDVISGPDGIRRANITLITPLLDFSMPLPQLNILRRLVNFFTRSRASTDSAFRTRCLLACQRALTSLALVLLYDNKKLLQLSLNHSHFQLLWLSPVIKQIVLSLRDQDVNEREPLAFDSAPINLVVEYTRLIVTQQRLINPAKNISHLREELDHTLKQWDDTSRRPDDDSPNVNGHFSQVKTLLARSSDIHRIHRILGRSVGTVQHRWLINLVTVFHRVVANCLYWRQFPEEVNIICQAIFSDLKVNQQAFCKMHKSGWELIGAIFVGIDEDIVQNRLDTTTDMVMSYLLLLLGLSEGSESSNALTAAWMHTVHSYIVERASRELPAMKLILDRDTSYQLESCVLFSLDRNPVDDRCVAAAWHLCQSMDQDAHDSPSSSCHERFQTFRKNLLSALRGWSEKTYTRHKPKYLKNFLDWTVVNDVLRSLSDPDQTKAQHLDPQTVSHFRLLVDNMLSQTAWVRRGHEHIADEQEPNAISVNLLIVADYTIHIAEDSSKPQDASHTYPGVKLFEQMTSAFLHSYEGEVHEGCQRLLGLGILKLVNRIRCVQTERTALSGQDADSKRLVDLYVLSQYLKLAFEISPSWKWINNLSCAQMISDAIDEHLQAGNSYIGYEKQLHDKCRALLDPMPIPVSDLHQDIDPDAIHNDLPDTETLHLMHTLLEAVRRVQPSETAREVDEASNHLDEETRPNSRKSVSDLHQDTGPLATTVNEEISQS